MQTGHDSLEAELRKRELERREALVGGDMEKLGALMADDLVHVHTTGNVQGKSELLGHAGAFLKFLEVERGPLQIRSLGPDAAVMTGPMTNTVQRRGSDEVAVIDAYVTQVWVRRDGEWQVASFHAVRVPDAS